MPTAVQIFNVPISGVLKVTIKAPYMIVPQSVKDGMQWMGLQSPRTYKASYRSQFIGIVTKNDANGKVIVFRIPNLATFNLPDHPNMQSAMLELNYGQILKAQLFQPTTPMAPDTVVINAQQFTRIGEAGKLPPIFIPSVPVLLIA